MTNAYAGPAIKGNTMCRIKFPGNRITHSEAGAVFNGEPSVQNARQFDNREDRQKKNREDQSEFHQALGPALAATNSTFFWKFQV